MATGLLWLCLLLAVVPSFGDDSKEQQLCKMMVGKFNTFVDMVPMIFTVTFSPKNDFFVGSSEIIFYSAENNPDCTLVSDGNLKLFKVAETIAIAILNQGKRMMISQCQFTAHIRLKKDDKHLYIDPQLVDVQIFGNVTIDGVLLDKKIVEENLRPTLVKGFTSLASEHLSHSGLRSEAIFVDPKAAASLLKQLIISYISQLV